MSRSRQPESNGDLEGQARSDYGSLIDRVYRHPEGLGIDVHLIGGEVIQYLPGIGKYELEHPSFTSRAARAWSRLIGLLRP